MSSSTWIISTVRAAVTVLLCWCTACEVYRRQSTWQPSRVTATKAADDLGGLHDFIQAGLHLVVGVRRGHCHLLGHTGGLDEHRGRGEYRPAGNQWTIVGTGLYLRVVSSRARSRWSPP